MVVILVGEGVVWPGRLVSESCVVSVVTLVAMMVLAETHVEDKGVEMQLYTYLMWVSGDWA